MAPLYAVHHFPKAGCTCSPSGFGHHYAKRGPTFTFGFQPKYRLTVNSINVSSSPSLPLPEVMAGSESRATGSDLGCKDMFPATHAGSSVVSRSTNDCELAQDEEELELTGLTGLL